MATALLRQVQSLADQWLRAYLVEKQTLDLRARLFLHAQRLSLAHHARRGTMDAVTRIEKDVRDAQTIVVESLLASVTARSSSRGCRSVTPANAWC